MKISQNQKKIVPWIVLHSAQLLLLIYNLIQGMNLETVWSGLARKQKAIPNLLRTLAWKRLEQNTSGICKI